MSQQIQAGAEDADTKTGWGHWTLELAGIATFAGLASLIAWEVYLGLGEFGYLWLLPVLAVLAYLTADLISGLVHFLADNFGSHDTPVIGPNFVQPFREHHTDPQGIVRHGFVDTNGNNSLISLPFMLLFWMVVPIASTVAGYLLGAFFLLVCLSVLLTNQFHKWAHMDAPPAPVARLQSAGLILSREHHDVHHESPYDTYYCITVGVWDPLLDRTRFFERAERLIRRLTPGTDDRRRVDREGNLNKR